MRRLVIGDIHGNYKALGQALKAVGYQRSSDRLHFLGDYVDRHSQSKEVVEFIIREVPDKICIRGNHDHYLLSHFAQAGPRRILSDQWKRNGGIQTLESYDIEVNRTETGLLYTVGEMPPDHLQFYNATVDYHFTEDQIALVHGGFDLELKDMSQDYVMWDRSMWKTALMLEETNERTYPCFEAFEKIYIGHTNLLDFPEQRHCLPRKCINVWNIDTGAGYAGPLTIMDMDTEEYWQSGGQES